MGGSAQTIHTDTTYELMIPMLIMIHLLSVFLGCTVAYTLPEKRLPAVGTIGADELSKGTQGRGRRNEKEHP